MRRKARVSTSWSIRNRQPFERVISSVAGRREGPAGSVRDTSGAGGEAVPTKAGSSMRTGMNSAGDGGTNAPFRTCRRQVNNRPGYIPCRAATSVTRAPGSLLSATIRSFCSTDHCRRRSRPVMISIASPANDFKLRSTHSFKANSLRYSPSRQKASLTGRLLADAGVGGPRDHAGLYWRARRQWYVSESSWLRGQDLNL